MRGRGFAQEDEIEWEIKNVIHRQGYIGHEQTAIAMAKVLMEANYGKNFVVESSLTAKQERRSMDAIWRVYGILTSEADDEEPQVRLLVVLDRYTGGVRGVTNFTKKQNPYTPFLLKSSKRGISMIKGCHYSCGGNFTLTLCRPPYIPTTFKSAS